MKIKITFYWNYWKCLTNKMSPTFFGDNFVENYKRKTAVKKIPFLLCWCQIVHFNYVGAKLSVFTLFVANCLGAKLSGCQIVRCEIVLPSWTWLSENMKDPNLRWPGHWGRRSKLAKKVESSRIFFYSSFCFSRNFRSSNFEF